ncbi:hypothetical protein E2C01_074791 [Portunus trituberculatus]|uniref:Uncharacterized protein n=1 Tax=Portunus trituberculatus TaxID=210409 RepID=A0A5B7IEF0_PORTR|nr:hypothetical protein [Portunus trituberculatus]
MTCPQVSKEAAVEKAISSESDWRLNIKQASKLEREIGIC